MRKPKLFFVASFCAVLAAPGGLLLADDVTGTWKMTVELSAGSGTPTFIFKQEGEKLTGTYQGTFGESAVTGTVKGDIIEFSFPVQDETVRYSGKVSGDSMEGTCDYGELGKGTFKGKKQ